MVGRLTQQRGSRWSARRRAAFAALVAAVALLHGIVTRDLAQRLAAADADARRPMPARIEVAYVRTLEPEVPQAVAAVAPTPPPPPPRRRAPTRRIAKPAADAASAVAAAQAETPAPPPASPAPNPEPPPEAAPTQVADAASLPDTASPPEAASSSVAALSAASAPPPALVADAGPAAAAAADPTASAASTPGGATFTWPSATRVSYVANGYWRGDITGSAEVEWIRVGSRYQVHVDVVAGPEFAPLFSRRMTSEGNLGETGLEPDRYDEETQVLMRERRRVSVVFEGDAIVLANGQRRERAKGAQDAASQFIQFTWLFGSQPERLRIGNRFDVPLALPRSMHVWTYDVVAEQTLQTTFGPLATFHVKPRRETRRPGEWAVDMWFAPELRFLPVRIRIEQESGSFVELVIARKPEIAGS